MKAGSEWTRSGGALRVWEGGHGPEGAKKTRGFSEVFRIFGCDSWQRHLSDGEKRKTFRKVSCLLPAQPHRHAPEGK